MSIYRADALQLSFLDEIFTDDFPELSNILMQADEDNYDLYDNFQEPLDFMPYESQKAEAKRSKRKSRWTDTEDSVIIDLVEKYGHSWKYFTKYLPDRPADSIKSRYYSYLKKKHSPQPRKLLNLMKPNLPTFPSHMTDDKVVDSLLNTDFCETLSVSSHSTADMSIVHEDGNKACLKRLYAKMSSLEKMLAKTYLEIDRLQTPKPN
mmetsp:Transcript_9425/g.18121  ORF Transcript_9425/g.18121 Transcript_9425/m.18121 type:complete len:207 (+) Transcript_9425:588-1208(+)|eukprot:CAMPEP_0204907016 /NCGR_PEP_ID=MMETSP1397-20131031/6278_1 /ASSEMBLY_ACC=CAM_ASM_000891 /TAXON_ID=49980 /ORGANISM="Climacostomum Climacostomum virens, Strain Stock W-24" /LENGTH=206 /DNA_ID=CAMNT_0052076031 /DNA_START=579 /DNA_END=1199 /DNA_ORIENTATION=+